MKSSGSLVVTALLVLVVIFFAIRLSASDDQANLISEDAPRQAISANLFQGQYFSFRLKKEDKEVLSSLSDGSEELSFIRAGKDITISAIKLLPGDTLSTLFPGKVRAPNKKEVKGKRGFVFSDQGREEFWFVSDAVLLKIFYPENENAVLESVVSQLRPAR